VNADEPIEGKKKNREGHGESAVKT